MSPSPPSSLPLSPFDAALWQRAGAVTAERTVIKELVAEYESPLNVWVLLRSEARTTTPPLDRLAQMFGVVETQWLGSSFLCPS